MIKKCGLIYLCLAGFASAQLVWQSGDLLGLAGFEETSDGWLVQMYRDANNDTDLSSLEFDTSGQAFGTNASDDVLLASFSADLEYVDDFFGESLTFSRIFNDFAAIYDDHVYTVVLDTDSWANATTANSTFVLDENTFQIPGENPGLGDYNPPTGNPGNHEWQSVIPEPGTMGMLAMGLVGLFAIRRKKII